MNINCDLGEGLPNDALLMPFLHSCNIACGGHAGNSATILKTIRLANAYGVQIGAHPSYPDRENFGRKVLPMPLDELKVSIEEQLSLFFACAQKCQVSVHHIKAHGAFYNETAKNETIAELFVDILLTHYPQVNLYAPPNSIVAQMACSKGISVLLEVFGDRTYEDDYSLVARSHPQAVISDALLAKTHIEHLLQGKVKTIHGTILPLLGDTLCIHGDNPGAIAILQLIQGYVSNS
jgi:5-oxoprolinase (ATP-hydrolysing) subunit A